MNTWIGAECVVSPLANTASENFAEIQQGKTAIKLATSIPNYNKELSAALFSESQTLSFKKDFQSKIEAISVAAINDSLSRINSKQLGKTLVILSTTKGDIDQLTCDQYKNARPTVLCEKIISSLDIEAESRVISMACISGLSAIIYAHDLLQAGRFDSVIVIGVDVVSKFTASGFDSFFALSKEYCKPYDANRKGLNLGEAASSVILSKNKELFQEESMIFSGGASSNDANHISGPSRTGEGLVRAIEKSLVLSHTKREDIDFISSHGTATQYNDDMESIAFTRCQLEAIPTSSFKGFYGHTLGAAGVLEIALCIQSMKNNVLIKNHGMEEFGCVKHINVLTSNSEKECNTVLKTASGFGGCNAAAIIKKEPK